MIRRRVRSGLVLFILAWVVPSATACRTVTTARAPALTSAEVTTSVDESAAAAQAVRRGDYATALTRADRSVVSHPENPWGHYQRAVALQHLGRTEEALAAYRVAEERFGDPRGRSIAIYGRARTLDEVGRCDEARRSYEEYAVLVGPLDDAGARMARAYANECRPGSGQRSTPGLGDLSNAVLRGEYARAVRQRASLPAVAGPWADYNAAVAQAALGDVDPAIASYAQAERGFAGANDPRGRAVAIWGRARALAEAGRCREAARAFGEFAALVRQSDPTSAAMADARARSCPDR